MTGVLGPAADIPVGEGRVYVVDGQQVAVFRLRGGGVRAVSAICPHAGGPLADGLIDANVVICPLHQHVYDLATGCSSTGQPALRVYDVRIGENGDLIITV
ncbi:Rieske (2Fe-2S) protein [Dactylosporangium sp. NPDC005555]|uniref:Rieske (2Fe-2S) protein n=1 Tax=Dactylosporangium sp. NPDC005555 TaxID=3154889 RepID=UPI0033BFAF67